MRCARFWKMDWWSVAPWQWSTISKPGLQHFWDKWEKVAVKALMQLHMVDTWTSMNTAKQSCNQRMQALLLLHFLKEKHTGTSRDKCAWMGRHHIQPFQWKQQRHLLNRQNQCSSQDSRNERKIQCNNMPSAFFNTDVEDNVYDMMIQIAPEIWWRYVNKDRKRGMAQ